MDFKKAYKFPLYSYCGKAFTKDNGMAFDFMGPWKGYTEKDEAFQEKIVSAINGDIEHVVVGRLVYDSDGHILLNGEKIILIRGWGNLTSPNCLNLTNEEAVSTQDEFALFIINKLTR
jgi:hypothetical protein